MPDTFKDYTVLAPDGTEHVVSAPVNASDEDLIAFVQQSFESEALAPVQEAAVATKNSVSQPAPRPDIAPNAMLGANADQTVATKTLEEIPGAREDLEAMIRDGKTTYEQARKLFADKYPDVPFSSGNNTPAMWSKIRQRMTTPSGRQYYTNNSVFGPINRETGIEDAETPDTVIGEVLQSGARSIHQMANTYRGAAALGADLVGADETAESWLDDYLEQSAAIDLNLPSGAGMAKDIDSFGDAAMWGGSVIGELLPQLAGSLGAGAVGGYISKKAIASSVKQAVEDQVAAGLTRKAAQELVAREMQKKIVRGGIAGATAQSIAQESGSIYGDTYGETGERMPWTSLLAGTAAGSLDALMPARILSKVGGPVAQDAMVDSLVKKIGKEAASNFLLEGGTEVLQTIIEQLPAGGPIDWDQVVEAGLRGGFGGAVAGGATGAYEGNRQNKAAPPVKRSTIPEGSAPISVPTETKPRTKAYREQLDKTRSEVETRVQELTGTWENAPEVEVHSDFTKLKGVSNNAIGVYADGKLQLNTKKILEEAKSRNVAPDDIVSAVTFHEGLGHHGLTQLFGEALDTKLAEMLGSSTVLQNRVQKWLEKHPDAYAGDPNRDLRAAEELFAEKSENGQLPASFKNQMLNTIKDFGRRMGLNLQYSSRELDTILGMAHAAVVSGKGRDASSNGFKFMYAGQKAETADLGRLDTAQYLKRSGQDAGPSGDTRISTGWFEGPDGKWRFEISDREASAHLLDDDDISSLIDELPDFSEATPSDVRSWGWSSGLEFLRHSHEGTTSLYLDQVLDHPALFEAYPELAEVMVFRKQAEEVDPDIKKNEGSYHPVHKVIYINTKLDEKEAMSVLLHEVQHAVQSIEGFAKGGNRDSAILSLPDDHVKSTAKNYSKWQRGRLKQKKNELAALEFAMDDPDAFEMAALEQKFTDYEQYLSSPPEHNDELEQWVREGAVQEQEKIGQAWMEAESRFLRKLGFTNRTDMSAEDAIQLDKVYEFLLKNPEPVDRYEALLEMREEVASGNALLNRLDEEVKKDNTELVRTILYNDKNVSFQAYQSLFGEVEARDVQARQGYDDFERQIMSPYTSEPEITPDQYVFDMADDSTEEMAATVYQGSPHDFDDKTPKIINKYMMMSSPDKVEFTPEEIAEMDPDEIFESENALAMLEKMVEGYTPMVLSNDDLQKEAELRGFTPGELLRSPGVKPGELTKRLFMYDIAASKLQDKITTLYAKMQDGQASGADYAAHAKALYQMQEVTQKIFDVQGEIGRSLNAMKTVNFTKRRVNGVMETVAQFQKNSPFEYLNDPDEYYKFATQIQQQIADAKEKMKASGASWLGNALNLPRALMSTLDLSAPLRQGLFLIHKPQWWSSFVNMFRYWGSERAFQDLQEDIVSRPTYPLMQAANLALSNADGKLNQREEDFQTEWAQKIPGFGKLVRMSERGYVGFLNKLRADVFDQLVSNLGDSYTPQDLKDIGRFINAASGRGNLPKALQGAAPVLNGLLFSPRLMASRIVMTTALVDPRTYTTMNKTARNEYVKSLLSVGSLALLVLSLAAMAGAEVEDDPRSSDFAKIKVGNTRYDILGGEAQYITLAARVALWSTKTADGQIKRYGPGIGKTTVDEAIIRFLRNKTAPIPSFIWDFFAEENAVGQPFEADQAIVERFTPMIMSDIMENAGEVGTTNAAMMGVPAFFGVGVSTYASRSLDTERDLDGPESFEMADAVDGDYGNYEVKNGTVMLDEGAQREWENRINFYYKEWMKDEMKDPAWKTATDDEKRDIIKAVRNDARKEAKADMLELLQIPEGEQ